MNEKIKLIADSKCWIEGAAIEQLGLIAALDGCTEVVGLPDLHPGRVPVGMAVKTEGIFYPHLIGNDIGCGMTLVKTGITQGQYKKDKWVKRLTNFQLTAEAEGGIGTLGGGNHFAEFQQLSEDNSDEMKALGITKKDILLLIHSGSRSFGQKVFERYRSEKGIVSSSDEAERYMAEHCEAENLAEQNRRLAAEHLVNRLGFAKEMEVLIDCTHNSIEQRGQAFIHRKGAVRVENGLLVIPGSRGSLTYIVRPTDKTAGTLRSLSHGAGRKYQRSECRNRMSQKHNKSDLLITQMKSSVVCRDKALLYEEAPEAYKNIEAIIGCLESFGLITVEAALKPLLTYKG